MSDPLIPTLRATCPTCETTFTYARLGLAKAIVGQLSTVGCPVCRGEFDTIVEEVRTPVWAPLWPDQLVEAVPLFSQRQPYVREMGDPPPVTGFALMGIRVMKDEDVNGLRALVDDLTAQLSQARLDASIALAAKTEALARLANAQRVEFVPTLTARSIRRP